MEIEEKNKKWKLNIEMDKLPVNQRKDSLVLLYFLNEHQEQLEAFKQLKKIWVDSVYKLPKTSSMTYKTVKNGRYNLIKKMKKLFDDYMVQL